MEMRYFWTSKKESQDVYSFKWYPGQEFGGLRVNITLGHTMPRYAHIIYMRKTPPWYYHGQ